MANEVWVVTCNQLYASFFYVVGVYDTEEKANEVAAKSDDYEVESFYLNKKPEE